MNPLLQQFLVTVFRWGLTFLAGFAVKLGIFKELGETEQYVAAGAVALAVLVWSLWSKYKGRIAFVKALESPAGTTEQEIKEQIKAESKTPVALFLWCLPMLSLALLLGCVAIKPGNDPLVVSTERFLTSAEGTFLLTLQINQHDREFFRENAPGFHRYCETLREPTPYPHFASTNILPQYRAWLLSVDDVKLAYKQGRSDSNAVLAAVNSLEAWVNKGQDWLAIVTNRTERLQ